MGLSHGNRNNNAWKVTLRVVCYATDAWFVRQRMPGLLGNGSSVFFKLSAKIVHNFNGRIWNDTDMKSCQKYL